MTVKDKYGHAESASVARYLGRHSNIPDCCIDFYNKHTHGQLIRINERRGLYKDLDVRYVMCTKCLRAYRSGKLRPNRLHDCEKEPFNLICARWSNHNYSGVIDLVTMAILLGLWPRPISPDYTV